MIREQFLGRNPSHFQVNPIVKAFIISEGFFGSAYNFVIPIFAVFVVSDIPNGNLQVAASSYSVFLITRVIFELMICRYIAKKSERSKFLTTILGTILVGMAYLGFSISNNISMIFICFAIVGVGLGISTPTKNTIFSTHLDKNKEATEWGIHDAVTFMGMASTAALGGFIASQYGFKFLFVLAASVNFLAIVPYLLYISSKKE